MYNPFSLSGKTILVTGASSGIGKATAIECSKMGATIIMTARNEERLQETIQLLEGEGHQYIIADLTNEDAIKQLTEQVPELDGVVCAAGISMLKPIQVLAEKDIKTIFDTNSQKTQTEYGSVAGLYFFHFWERQYGDSIIPVWQFKECIEQFCQICRY